MEEYIKRLYYELNIINSKGYTDYFLIVWDFVAWAHKNNIMVGPGRGSIGGSLVSFLVNISRIDPIKHDLLFERFLNPERMSMPDADLDFHEFIKDIPEEAKSLDRFRSGRDRVINYLLEKYSNDNVCQIITFGRLMSRLVLKDVGRVLKEREIYPDLEQDLITILIKLIPM